MKLGFTPNTNHPRYVQAKMAIKLPAPKLTNTWAAGLSFGKCHSWKATPYDPGLRKVRPVVYFESSVDCL